MMISCEEAADICTKKQYKEASFWQTMKLKLHVFFCKTCAHFTTKNTKLTSLCNQAHLHVLSEVEKKSMQKSIDDQL